MGTLGSTLAFLKAGSNILLLPDAISSSGDEVDYDAY